METALLAMAATTMAMMGLLWVAMAGLYRQMGRLETILSFAGLGIPTTKARGVPSRVFLKTRINPPADRLAVAMSQCGIGGNNLRDALTPRLRGGRL